MKHMAHCGMTRPEAKQRRQAQAQAVGGGGAKAASRISASLPLTCEVNAQIQSLHQLAFSNCHLQRVATCLVAHHSCVLSVLPCVLQRRIVAQNIKRLKDIGCYRGRRHIMVRRSTQRRGGHISELLPGSLNQ